MNNTIHIPSNWKRNVAILSTNNNINDAKYDIKQRYQNDYCD